MVFHFGVNQYFPVNMKRSIVKLDENFNIIDVIYLNENTSNEQIDSFSYNEDNYLNLGIDSFNNKESSSYIIN